MTCDARRLCAWRKVCSSALAVGVARRAACSTLLLSTWLSCVQHAFLEIGHFAGSSVSVLPVQGTACPESGFCGVEVCGSWSQGAEDTGTRCTSERHSPIGPGAPAAVPGSPSRRSTAAPESGAASPGTTDMSADLTASPSSAAGLWGLCVALAVATAASMV